MTLNFAVTGRMAGGREKVIRQTISREDALIAHTRKNAYFVFRENDLGSIQPGKLADLVVLDRDYLTIPADQIKDIKPVITMVGGRIVYDSGSANVDQVALAAPSRSRSPTTARGSSDGSARPKVNRSRDFSKRPWRDSKARR